MQDEFDHWAQTVADQWAQDIKDASWDKITWYLMSKQEKHGDDVYGRIMKYVYKAMDPEGLETGTIWEGPPLKGRTPGRTPSPRSSLHTLGRAGAVVFSRPLRGGSNEKVIM